MNTLITIGYTGIKRAYLNIPRDEAIRRWMESECADEPPEAHNISEFVFTDEFGTYDSWSLTS